MSLWRPIPMNDPARPAGALPLAGGPLWFAQVEEWEPAGPRRLRPAADLPPDWRDRLTAPRAPWAGLALDRPRIMGIVNVTPDSFSDGGRYFAPGDALARARELAAEGAEILDLGGESTRPGAAEVPEAEEIARTAPVIAGLSDLRLSGLRLSIDTRKAAVAAAALAAGAAIVNDVTGLAHDPAMAGVVARSGAGLCLMHSRGTPQSMAGLTDYADVLAEVYLWLAGQVEAAVAAGIARERIVVDPGIGFAKTAAQNLTLLRGLSLFHGLGCGVLVGASRKRFIGTIGGAEAPEARMPGSLAVALAAVAQGAQVVRVHDVAATAQALRLWQAVGEAE